MELFGTVIAGVSVASAVYLIKEFIFDPIKEFEDLVRKIDFVTVYYAQYIANPEKKENLPDELFKLRLQAGDELRHCGTMYFVLSNNRFVKWYRDKIRKDKNIQDDAYKIKGIMIGLSNKLFNSDPRHNSEERDQLRKLLGLPHIRNMDNILQNLDNQNEKT